MELSHLVRGLYWCPSFCWLFASRSRRWDVRWPWCAVRCHALSPLVDFTGISNGDELSLGTAVYAGIAPYLRLAAPL
jgi:hypothetical protein